MNMQFLYPSFLWALLALAIPVLIHLFYFRRFKRVYFTNVRFLKEIKEETSNRNKLKNLLVLLARMLTVIFLVLAFAQPFIPTGTNIKSGIRHVSVFVDNSFSMTTQQDDIPLLDIAKEKARNIIQSYNDDDKFQILTHDFEGKHQRFISKEDALTYIDDIKSSPSVYPLSQVMQRQLQLMQSATSNKISYIISDYQKSICDFESYQDTSVEINLMPLQAPVSKNVFVDSVWFDGPVPMANQNNKLVIRIRNGSTEDAEDVKVTFRKDGQEKPLGLLDVPGLGAVTDTMIVKDQKTGWQQAVVAINDYPVQFDDDYHVSYLVPDTIRILQIYETTPNRYLSAAVKGLPQFTLNQQSSTQLQFQSFRQQNLIVLDDISSISTGLAGELIQYLKDGGKVLLFPSATASAGGINPFLNSCNSGQLGELVKARKEVSLMNTESFVFRDVYIPTKQNITLPVTSLSFPLNTQALVGQENLLTFRDAMPALTAYRVGEGQLFLSTSPLAYEYNNLATNAEVFVPMIYKMAIASAHSAPLAYFISSRVVIETTKPSKTGDFVFKVTNGKEEFLPGLLPSGNRILLDVGSQIRNAGIYDIFLDEPVSKAAFNYNRLESDMAMLSESALAEINPANPSIRILSPALQANIAGTITEKDRGIALWKWCIFGVLLFLAMETFLIRFLKS
jgi:hypothetical protein